MSFGYGAWAEGCEPGFEDCSQAMPHQDTVLLIYVFSIFGLVLVVMMCSFYACHLYAQRAERLRLLHAPPPTQVADQDHHHTSEVLLPSVAM